MVQVQKTVSFTTPYTSSQPDRSRPSNLWFLDYLWKDSQVPRLVGADVVERERLQAVDRGTGIVHDRRGRLGVERLILDLGTD